MEIGYNNPWFFNQFKDGYPTESVVGQIKALSQEVIRFPGGTSSFLFDITKPGYGYAAYDGDTRTNYAPAHVRLAGQIGAKTAYVANLYQALIKPESTEYWINNIVQTIKVLNPEYVELGNEFPIYPELTGVKNGEPGFFQSKTKFIETVRANAYKYRALCEQVMFAIRAHGYTPKFGVVMDLPLHTRGRTWNAAIRESLEYDAEIFHYYSRPQSKEAAYNELAKILAGARGEIWITESNWQMGSDCTLNQKDVGTPAYNAFKSNVAWACNMLGVDMLLWHQLYGKTNYCTIKQTP